MKKAVTFIILAASAAAFALYHYSHKNSAMNGHFIYYPTDEHARFTQDQTSLQWVNQTGKDRYTLRWRISSKLNEMADARHDMSLLYEDGLLIATMSKHASHVKSIKAEKKINREDSGHFEAISLHYARLDYPNGQILSRRQMSYDQLYVTASPLSQMDKFEVPKTEPERQWKKILNHSALQQLQFAWNESLKNYHIPVQQYYRFPLPYLHIYDYNRLPGCTESESEQALGKLWNLLYKDYYSGIPLKNGKTVSPIGSTVPLILFAKNRSRFIILTTTKSGQDVKLVQPLE